MSYRSAKLRSAALFGAACMLGLICDCTKSAQAGTVDVSYTISGSPGDWTYDFSVTNNFGGTNYIYAIVLQLSGDTVTGSPPGWGQTSIAPVEWCYDSNCFHFGLTNLAPGQTLDGFPVNDTGADPTTSVQWDVYAEGGVYNGSDNITGNPSNPGVSGVATPVPVPSTLPLFASGLGLLGLLGWRRRRKATVTRTRKDKALASPAASTTIAKLSWHNGIYLNSRRQFGSEPLPAVVNIALATAHPMKKNLSKLRASGEKMKIKCFALALTFAGLLQSAASAAPIISSYDISSTEMSGYGGWNFNYSGTITPIGGGLANYTGGGGTLNDGIVPTNVNNDQLFSSTTNPVITVYLNGTYDISSIHIESANLFNLIPGDITSVTVSLGGVGQSYVPTGGPADQTISLGGTQSAIGVDSFTLSNISGSYGNYFAIGELVVDGSQVVAVSEPSTFAMMIVGFVGVGYGIRRSRRRILAAA